MSEITEQVGQLIREARKEKGLTQEEFAERLGISQGTANRYETGKQNLTIDTIQKIAKILEADINILFKG